PAVWTYENIDNMRTQLKRMGISYDWDREVATCDPAYYKWEQLVFIRMLERGLAYRRRSRVNWCPSCQTVLANEQVEAGRCWRCDSEVTIREIDGWFFKITDYAQELLDHVQIGNPNATLTGWPDKVRLMQENWLGKSEGVRFAFPHEIKDAQGALIQDGKMYVFTTRADTIMGVTFVAVAPEHPIAVRAGELSAQLATKIEALKAGGTTEAELALKEKEGVATGLFVSHPLTGEQIEVWVGNYVLISYGDGAVMGVPAHDERDFAFAKKYAIQIKPVYRRIGAIPDQHPGVRNTRDHVDEKVDVDAWNAWYGDKHDDLLYMVNSGPDTNDLSVKEALQYFTRKLVVVGGEEKPPGVYAIGASAANATGVRRSLSCIAPSMVRSLCLMTSCQ
ncbi:MAG: class I tRNA ligase family protein, partial [Brachymonas sp.]|nr:class I tRNA ligase family protein [Brachymonas sp.]